MSWFRTHRPRQIKDLHLASVRETLAALMAEGKIPQAMLFAGPKGTGKTSASRIIAAVLNDPQNKAAVEQIYLRSASSDGKKAHLPKLVEPDPDSALTQRICAGQSFAVQEIDAASHGLVDDVRQLKERAALLPQEGSMAVYILDEAHMMSGAAFNAFLKLLEEPPAHAVFILATTELHKIPATIASRCLVVRFQKASDVEIVTTLSHILKKEQITFQPEQLLPIVAAADGSFRDAVKLLELSVAGGALDSGVIAQVAGQSLESQLDKMVSAVISKDTQTVVEIIANLRAVHADTNRVHKTLFTLLHQDLLLGLQSGDQQSKRKSAINQFLLQQLLAAQLNQSTPIALLPLELALLDVIIRAKQKQSPSAPGQVSPGSKSPTSSVVPTNKKTTVPAPHTDSQDEDEDEVVDDLSEEANAVVVAVTELPVSQEVKRPVSKATIDPAVLLTKWQDFLAAVATKNPSLAALLRSSQPSSQVGTGMTIGVFYRFHQEQLQQAKSLDVLEACCREITGGDLPFSFVLTQNQPVADTNTSTTPGAVITAVPVASAPGVATPAQSTGLAAMASEVLL